MHEKIYPSPHAMMHTNLDGMWSKPNTEMAYWTAASRT